MSDFTLQLNYTDALRTALIGHEGDNRDFQITTGTDVMDVDVLIVSAKKTSTPKNETALEVVLRPTGAWAYT